MRRNQRSDWNFMYNFKSLDILWAWIRHHSQKLWPIEFLESFCCSFSSGSIYHGPHTYTRVKSYVRLNLPRAFVFNFDRFDILCAWIENPSEMLLPFEFLESFPCSFSNVSKYHAPHTYTRVKSYGRLNLRSAFMFNFERLDILWAWIGDPSKMLWAFEFIEILYCSFSRVLIYHGRHAYTRVKSYGRLNLPKAFVLSFKRLDILRAWIGHPSEMLRPFEFGESLRCSFFSVSIYHGPHTYTRVKSYGRLNLPRAYMFNFERLDILWTGIGDLSENLWPFEFLESFHGSFFSVSKYHGRHIYTWVKIYGCLNFLGAFVYNFESLDILEAWIGHPRE